MKIVVDLGSTYTKIAILDSQLKITEITESNTTADKLAPVISAVNKHNATILVLAVAGPTSSSHFSLTAEHCRTIYLTKTLKNALPAVSNLFVLNDMEIAAYAIPHKNAILIGIGTGIGVSCVLNGTVYPSEAGHISAHLPGPLKTFLQRKHATKHVSFDRVLSAAGAEALYEFLFELVKSAPEIFRIREFAAIYFQYLREFIAQLRCVFGCNQVVLIGGVVLKNLEVFERFSAGERGVEVLRERQAGLAGGVVYLKRFGG